MSPALAGRFLFTEPPGKSCQISYVAASGLPKVPKWEAARPSNSSRPKLAHFCLILWVIKSQLISGEGRPYPRRQILSAVVHEGPSLEVSHIDDIPTMVIH